MILATVETTDKVYWCLLLDPLGHATFNRIAVAMLYPRALNVLEVGYSNITIV